MARFRGDYPQPVWIWGLQILRVSRSEGSPDPGGPDLGGLQIRRGPDPEILRSRGSRSWDIQDRGGSDLEISPAQILKSANLAI